MATSTATEPFWPAGPFVVQTPTPARAKLLGKPDQNGEHSMKSHGANAAVSEPPHSLPAGLV